MSYLELSGSALINQEREAMVESWLAGGVHYTTARSTPPASAAADMAGCESCADCASFEFQPENIAPFYNNRTHFLHSQWRIPWVAYVVYRVSVAVLISAWIMADFLDEAGKFYSDNYAIYMIFATNWSFLMLGVSAIMHAIIVVVDFIKAEGNCFDSKPDESGRGLDLSMMIFWVIYNIAFNGAIVVTLSYWSFLVSVDQAGFLVTEMSRMKHTLNTIYVLFDMMFSHMPVRIFHVIFPLFVGAVYTVFNVVYFTNNGLGPNGQPYAYYVMDWRNPLESALTCSVGFIFTTIIQCVMYGVYRLRLCLYGQIMNVRYDTIALESGELMMSETEEGSDGEVENILGERRGRTASYSSIETQSGSAQRGIANPRPPELESPVSTQPARYSRPGKGHGDGVYDMDSTTEYTDDPAGIPDSRDQTKDNKHPS